MRLAGILALGLAGLFGLLLAAVAVGSTPLGVARVLEAVLAGSGADPIGRIVLDLRLPRALLAVVVGAGLGMVGAVLQTLTRNDLADPFLFGLSSGAAAGAVVVITVTGNVLGFWTLPAAAFAGGLIASLIVLGDVTRLIARARLEAGALADWPPGLDVAVLVAGRSVEGKVLHVSLEPVNGADTATAYAVDVEFAPHPEIGVLIGQQVQVERR